MVDDLINHIQNKRNNHIYILQLELFFVNQIHEFYIQLHIHNLELGTNEGKYYHLHMF